MNAHVAAPLASDRGDLASDEARADDVDRPASTQQPAQPVRVRKLAQIRRIIEPGKHSRVRSGRDAKAVPIHCLAALEEEGSTLDAQLHDTLAEHQLDLELPILLRRPQRQPVAGNGARQITLAQVWPLVRKLSLRPDQRDLAVKARVAKPGRHRVPGPASADDSRFRSSSRSARSDQNRYPPSSPTANP